MKILSQDPENLQKALDIIQNWSEQWQLSINPAKSEHLCFTFNKNNQDHDPKFFINNSPIPSRDNVRDLGILLSKNLKWENYISKITSKAKTLTYTILRTFQSKDIRTLINLYKTYIRPIMEYNSPIWTPNLIQDNNRVESVQRYFTRRLCQNNNIKYQDYNHRLQILNLESLKTRRIKQDIILMYKIYHSLIDIKFSDFFTRHSASSKYSLRGHDQRLQTQKPS